MLAGAAPVAEPRDLVLDASQPFIQAEVAGSPVRLRVSFQARGAVVLNRAAARRAGLRAAARLTMAIGPVRFDGHSRKAGLSIGGESVATVVEWYDRDVAADADGLVSPAVLPFDRVILKWRGMAAPGRQVRIRVRVTVPEGIHAPLRAADRTIAVRFAPDSETVATTAAAAALISAGGGEWEGEKRSVEIGFGVKRPVRQLRLVNPVTVGGFRIERFLARLADFAGDTWLPPPRPTEPDEVVVAAPAATQAAVYRAVLGAPALAGCAWVEYDARRRELTFGCA